MRKPLLVLAVLLASLSFALQVKKHISPLDKFMAAANPTELDYRSQKADLLMMRETTALRDGVGVPFIWDIPDDHQHIIVRTFISEKNLPKSFDERKEAILNAAWEAYGSVVTTFDLKYDDQSTSAMVVVQFINIADLAKDGSKTQPYAEFKNLQLAFR